MRRRVLDFTLALYSAWRETWDVFCCWVGRHPYEAEYWAARVRDVPHLGRGGMYLRCPVCGKIG